jgi:hypothetical protein
MSFLMTNVGLNVFFSINQSVPHHSLMLLMPYVSQLSNVTSQLKDIDIISKEEGHVYPTNPLTKKTQHQTNKHTKNIKI